MDKITIAELIKHLSTLSPTLPVYKCDDVLSEYFPFTSEDLNQTSVKNMCTTISKNGEGYTCTSEEAKELVSEEGFTIIDSFDALLIS